MGIFYLASAVFNLAYTVPLSDEPDTFEGYAEGAWFGFLRDFMEEFFASNAGTLMILVIIFEVAVGLLVLGRDRWVDLGVALSVLWVLAVLPFLAWPYLLVNVVLAVVQGVLLLRTYDTTFWRWARTGFRDTRATDRPVGA